MNLNELKIDIIENVNDLPSKLGDANHPNDALLCQKYNSLIDEISLKFDEIDKKKTLNRLKTTLFVIL